MGCPNGSVIGFSFLSFYSFLPFDVNYFLFYFVFSSEYRNFAVINRIVVTEKVVTEIHSIVVTEKKSYGNDEPGNTRFYSPAPG